MKTLNRPLDLEFTFAGIDFPKYLWSLPRGSMAKRLERAKNPCAGDYYHSPTPNNAKGIGFYLGSDGPIELRWQWADEVVDLHHTGWYSDEFGDSEKIRGIVLRLPHGRGFLAGWSMGESMASSLDYDIYETAEYAALAADSMAERAAENQREHEEKEREEEKHHDDE